MSLSIGDKMPSFQVINQDGKRITEQDMLGKKIVLYFYPKDSTPGCTAEACNLRDNYQTFLSQGYQIYGVSKDSIQSHISFRSKYELPFPLLSDTSTKMIQALGAWGEKKMYGKIRVGTIRKTFIFDEQNVLVRIIDKVDTKNHASQLL